MARYVVHTCEVTRSKHGEVYVRDVTNHVEAKSEADAVRAVMTPGDNGAHLPRGSSVLLGGQVSPMRPLSESLVVGVVGVEEYEPEEGP